MWLMDKKKILGVKNLVTESLLVVDVLFDLIVRPSYSMFYISITVVSMWQLRSILMRIRIILWLISGSIYCKY